jgi:hypothetical protein
MCRIVFAGRICRRKKIILFNPEYPAGEADPAYPVIYTSVDFTRPFG